MSEVPKEAISPLVCAVMLANGRQEMVARAVRCFDAQTYPNRILLVFDTGDPHIELQTISGAPIVHVKRESRGDTIGALRNRANELTSGCDIICHFDSDDFSHQRRIEEQVQRLLCEREVTGYNQMLFWDSRNAGESWLYTGAPRYMLGTSLCYWRETWQRKPFPHTSIGEDLHWQDGLRGVSGSSIPLHGDREPRMIASIHGGNTCGKIEADKPEWRRAPEWYEHVRARMAL